MRVLISGSSGFVGRHFVRRLLDDGYSVVAVDVAMPHLGPAIVNTRYQIVVDDIRRFMALKKADEFDLIIHCAAIVGGRLNIDGDPLAVSTNLSIDCEFFRWIARSKTPKRVVYFSSSAVYPVELQTRRTHCGLAEGLVDLTMTRLGMPDQTYGWSKLTGELLAQKAVKDYGAEVVIYRPFGGYGEDQSLDYPFPSIIKRVMDGEDPVVVWGSGEQQRDFIHIDDVVEGVLSTYDKLPPGGTLNLGTGRGVSFRKLAELACHSAGRKAEVVNDPTKPEGVFSRICDPYQMETWFTYKITLEEGIERAIHLPILTAPGA